MPRVGWHQLLVHALSLFQRRVGDDFRAAVLSVHYVEFMARLPLVEGLLHGDILIAQRIEERPLQVCKDAVDSSVITPKT